MENILWGIILISIAVGSLLESFGLVTVLGDWSFVWSILVLLIGLLLILRAQGKMAADKTQRKSEKEQDRVKRKLASEHKAKEKVLEKQLADKDRVVHQQEEVIDDMINPKI